MRKTFAPLLLLGSICAQPLLAQSGVTSPTPQDLFSAVPAGISVGLYDDEAAVQQRNVFVDLALLGNDDSQPLAPGAAIKFNLFDGEEFVGKFTGHTPIHEGGYIANFDLDGYEHGHAWVSVVNDAVVATIHADDMVYKLNYVGQGQSTVSEIDGALQPPCGTHGTGLEIGPGEKEHDHESGNNNRFVDHEIDVMVVYTDNARFTNGGTDGINALINLAVHETNMAYSRSDVWQRLMLVHTEEISWFEDGDDFGYLSDLQGTADGVADDVHNLRDAYGADMVSLIYDNGSYCGVAYIMTTLSSTFESSAFSVVRDSCATGYYSFAHELGHNMGSAHDRANAGSALTSYSYGWRTADSSYRSVMAYAPGTRIPTFSNPVKDAPNGQALGTATDNNAASLNYSATTVSAWRSSVDYGHRVQTLMASNNGQAGNMFDIEPKTDIQIWALKINTSSTASDTYNVWVREGGFTGHESSSFGWELWGSDVVTGTGTDLSTYIYPGTRKFDADTTYGVYIEMASYDGSSMLRYTNGTPQTWENNYLKITSGVGKASGWAGAIYADRQWNGAIYYDGAQGQVQMETMFASNNGLAGNMFDVDVENDIVINSFDVNIDSSAAPGTAHVDVWMKSGGHAGYEDDVTAWTYVGTDLAETAAVIDLRTRIAVGDIRLSAGQTYAFYINLASYADGHIMRYTNSTGTESYSNSDLTIHTGKGMGTNTFNQTGISNRTWNGRINYSGDHTGPHLWLADLAGGQTNHVRMAGCTPGAAQYASWSVAGGGPQGSPWGTIYLSNPYFTLPPVNADSSGNCTISTFSPPSASGLQVWVQALDVGTLELTNGATLLIQ
jgi:peptidyl-Asp metalloendopeptidase